MINKESQIGSRTNERDVEKAGRESCRERKENGKRERKEMGRVTRGTSTNASRSNGELHHFLLD